MTEAVSTPVTQGELKLAESRLLIDGELREALSGKVFDNINPATEEVIGVAADAGLEEVDAAIAAARRAFDTTTWSTDGAFRARCLFQLADAMEAHRDDLGEVLTAEGGVPVAMLDRMQFGPALSGTRWHAELAGSYEYERRLAPREALGAVTEPLIRKESVGVVAAITAWNFPLFLNMAKLAPALAAGCTVILKPAPDTPWSATALGRLIVEHTDIPAGVVNILSSSRVDVGVALTTDPRVDVVTFTGSTATGRVIGANAAATVKRTLLELGGKSAAVVLPDADLQQAIAWTAGGICSHAGQGCALSSRLLLPRSRYDEGLAIAEAMMSGMPAGDPNEPTTLCGPVINKSQYDKVLDFISEGQEGARLVTGGGRLPGHDHGYFIAPTLLADVDPDARIAQEEIFGPVLTVTAYADVDEAVAIANNSIYGLSGSVFGTDIDNAVDVARRIRTGTIAVNGAAFLDNDLPFGGYRQSGNGRERGVEGFEDFLETKTIGIPGSLKASRGERLS